MGRSAKFAAMLLLPMALSACAASDDSKPITFTDDRGVANQPFPNNFRTEVLAFLKTYSTTPSACATLSWPSRSSASSADGCATSFVFGSVHANPTAATASRANAPFVRRRPARPYHRNAISPRRRRLCAIRGAGENDAVAIPGPSAPWGNRQATDRSVSTRGIPAAGDGQTDLTWRPSAGIASLASAPPRSWPRLKQGDTAWESMVPAVVVDMIKAKHLFGWQTEGTPSLNENSQ